MVTTPDGFTQWLTQAQLSEARLTADQRAVLHAVFRFRQQQGDDYFSTRLLSHFLLHADTGLKVAHLARLLGLSRPTASRQQGLSSKQAIQQAHHRLDGRPYGKLLPRYAGPIAHFLCTHPDATRAALLAFIDQTFGVRVSRIALYKFLKKFGLDEATRHATTAAAALPARIDRPDTPRPGTLVSVPANPPPTAAPPFSTDARSTRERSC